MRRVVEWILTAEGAGGDFNAQFFGELRTTGSVAGAPLSNLKTLP
jgi:hypothetical protein